MVTEPVLSSKTSWELVLARMEAHSRHLSRLLRQQADIATQLNDTSAQQCFEQIIESIAKTPPTHAATMQQLRVAKQQASLCIAIAELSGEWDIAQVTAALSQLADAAMQAALRCLWHGLQQQGLVDASIDVSKSGLTCIAMGKWGAGELNYSSDIDLMLLYDSQKLPWQSSQPMQVKMNQLGRDVITLLQDRTEDGYVFRTDLRLRPDPSSTPLVMSVDAALTYYETVGQHWERAALIKARAAAGDASTGQYVLDYLRRFVWRKSLDMDMIHDIASIKRQIDHKHGGDNLPLGEIHLKLGHGGIRDIEFYTQTQQLIWGGREKELREPQTCNGLRALAENDHIDQEVADALISAYGQLRHWEHGVQMLEDAQRHHLPEQQENQEHLAKLLGAEDSEAFYATIRSTMQQVRALTQPLFDEHEPLSDAGNLVFTGIDHDPETLISLGKMGFSEPEQASSTIRRWHSGICTATQSVRARELLTEQTPAWLKEITAFPEPDDILKRLDQLLLALPVGIPLFSLVQTHPHLRMHVIAVLGLSPMLAEWLPKRPQLLESMMLVHSEHEYRHMVESDLRHWLQQPSHASWHVMVMEHVFVAGYLLTTAQLTPTDVATLLAEQATAAVRALVESMEVEEQGWAILSVGKLADQHLTLTSDIDMIALHDGTEEASANAQHVMRQLQEAMKQRAWGIRSWELDMRMRPHGDDGPLAIALPAAEDYYRMQAWSYEKLALTRIAPLAGDEQLAQQAIASLSCAISTLPISREATLREDILALRQKVQQHIPALEAYSVKHQPGGILDLEWAGQSHMLTHGAHALPAAPLTDSLMQDSISTQHSIACAKQLADYYAWQMMHRTLDIHALFNNHSLCMEAWKPYLEHKNWPEEEPAMQALVTEMLAEGESIFTQLITEE